MRPPIAGRSRGRRRSAPGPGGLSVGEEVEYVSEHAAGSLVDFRVLAPRAGYGREPLALDVEDLCEESPGSPELADVALAVRALRTFKIDLIQACTSHVCWHVLLLILQAEPGIYSMGNGRLINRSRKANLLLDSVSPFD